MNVKHLAALAAVMLLAVSACSKEEAQPTSTSSSNRLLSFVPHASPYLAANLEPIPDDVIDRFLQRAQPVLLAAQAELVKTRDRLANGSPASGTGNSLALAVLQELDGKLNRSGLESLGFDLQSNRVFYGMGAFPVARIGLSDAKALKSTVQRVLAHAGIQAPEQNFQGHAYWRFVADTSSDHTRAAVDLGVYAAILEDHFVLGIYPVSEEKNFLPLFLGLKKPAASDAEKRLLTVNRQYGFTPYFTGLLDLQLLANEFLQPDSLLVTIMNQAGAKSLSGLSQECKSEIRGIISHAPRLVAGTTELTPDSVGVQYIVETAPELAKQLTDLVTDVPPVDMVSARMVEFSFGLKPGPLRDFLRDKMMAITQAPYQCEHLQKLNADAADALAKLNRPMPPLVNNFRGLRVSLSHLNILHSIPEEIEGLMAFHVEQPEMFVGMAQMFLPDLSSLKLVKGNPPQQIPSSLIPIANVVAYAALSDNAIGISIGAGEEKGLASYLEQKAGTDGSFMSLNYDTAAYLDLTQGMTKKWQHAARSDQPPAAAEEIAKAVRDTYKAVAGRSRLNLRFTEHGLVIDNRVTFR